MISLGYCECGGAFEETRRGIECILCGQPPPKLRVIPTVKAADAAARLGHHDVEPAGSTVRASAVVPRNVDWLWPGRVPLGMPTVFGGFPGVGKSTILYDLAARTSREGRAVLVVTAEDHLAAVVRPRLEAADADLDRVHILTVPLTLPDGADLLARLLADLGVVLLILDPLVAFIGDSVNTHRDHHVRRVLAPLAALAEGTGAAVVVVVHTNKSEGSEPLMRISGSIGFTGAARSVLLAADDPQDESRRILAVVKSNLARFPAPLAYRVVDAVVGGEIATSKIEWLGEAPEVDVGALLARRDDPDERTAIQEAMEFLKDAGVQETARPAADILRAAVEEGITEKTLQRARRRLGILPWRGEFHGPVWWGPRPGAYLDALSGHPQPIQPVQIGADQGKQPLTTPYLDNRKRLGSWVPTAGFYSAAESCRCGCETIQVTPGLVPICPICGEDAPSPVGRPEVPTMASVVPSWDELERLGLAHEP